jgi:hypothetical protein
VLYFRRLLNHSSPSFLLLINLGAVLYACALLTYAREERDVTDNVCLARLWLQGIGFALLFGTLFAKAHRVHLLFNVYVLQQARLTGGWVCRLLCALLTAEVSTLTVFTFTLPCTASVRSDPLEMVRYMVCASGSLGFTFGPSDEAIVVLTLIHLGFLAWGVSLSFLTRHVSVGFNESLWIGLSVYNVFACELLGFMLRRMRVSGKYLSESLQYVSSKSARHCYSFAM